MDLLITGSSGRLGKELYKVFPGSYHPTRKELDITDREKVFAYIRKIKPDIVIHCAALADIISCEKNKAIAFETNVGGTKNLIKACEKHRDDVYFIYISTASVFYGDKGDYVETDIPHPKNFYSLTKLLGEFVVLLSELKKQLIIRTNFVSREKWRYPKAFIDRYGTYLFADDLALAIKSIINKNLTGIVHLCGEEKMSMYELAKITTPNIKSMKLDEYNGPSLTVDMSLRSIVIKPFRISKAKNIKHTKKQTR